MSVLDQFALDGKNAIVTGGSRGIGRAIAEALADAGANVVIANRSSDDCQEAASEISDSTGVQSLAVPTDVTDESSVKHLVDRTVEEFGGIDVLINNAGIATVAPAETKTLEDWQKTVDTNLTGVFLCSKHAGRVMREGDGGVILNISSITARVADPDASHVDYHASKGGVEAFTRQLATEWGNDDIRVNALAPGIVQTDMSTGDSAVDARRRDRIPLGSLACPDDLAGAAVFLVSDAASYVTGETLTVDGGYLAT
ncbi:SDR family NAD(P)-dependent oxidoreductase [Halogeometricum sp. CBA1124]|uniref:SDR family NAD(P)-dependent oxidoreductase n=1 Tax=Halogeometricum sp. CBA1124 TaxID=2668071 RepID=UPI00142969E8|nr:3-oxoacyl-ACP reductase family protein [Halogeometricum sp. CBA1124]MUV56831.1 glucose 1-dehydrogenase [Halogeometricum sp. CBA1124]